MGNDAVEVSNEATEDKIEVVLEDTLKESEESKEPDGVEVVRLETDGSQPTVKKHGNFHNRIARLSNKIEAQADKANEATEKLRQSEELNKTLQLRIDQIDELKAPNPDDFGDTAAFTVAQNEYTQSQIVSEVKKATANTLAVQNNTPAKGNEWLKTHYDAADKLGAGDYLEVEDQAIDIIGTEAASFIIEASDQAHVILYYLGKNPKEAENIAYLAKTNPGKATLQIGRLEAELKVKPKAINEPTPDPDDELKGGSPAAGTDTKNSKAEKQIDAMRQQVSDGTKTFSDLIALKKEIQV